MNEPDITTYAERHTTSEPELLQELAAFTRENVPGAQMLCERVEGRLLKWLIGLTGAKRVLELGTYTGYSALSMAEALPEEGYLLTCDRNPEALAIAKQYFAQSEHGYKIHITQQLILDLLTSLVDNNQSFDFIFIDADKKPLTQYVELCLPLLTPNGMIVVDNTLWGGEVLHPLDKTGMAIAKFNDDLMQRNDIEVLQLPIRDGVTLIKIKQK